MHEYTWSLLKMKKLTQLTEEVVTVKELINMEDDKLLQEMVENHQIIFKTLNMSKIYFKQLQLQQEETNKLVENLQRTLLESLQMEECNMVRIDEDILVLKLIENSSKLRMHTREMIALLSNSYENIEETAFEASILQEYLKNGGRSSIAIHRAAQLTELKDELPTNPPSADCILTICEIIDFVVDIPDMYLDAIDLFIAKHFRHFDFSKYDENEALEQAVVKLEPKPLAFEAPVLEESAHKILERSRELERDYLNLTTICIPDLDIFVRYSAQYTRAQFLGMLANGSVYCINSHSIINDIKRLICPNHGVFELFKLLFANPIILECLDETISSDDAKMWIALGQ